MTENIDQYGIKKDVDTKKAQMAMVISQNTSAPVSISNVSNTNEVKIQSSPIDYVSMMKMQSLGGF